MKHMTATQFANVVALLFDGFVMIRELEKRRVVSHDDRVRVAGETDRTSFVLRKLVHLGHIELVMVLTQVFSEMGVYGSVRAMHKITGCIYVQYGATRVSY